MKCPKCHGQGTIYRYCKPRIICDRCSGTGKVPRPKGKAFTLLELLIVMTVIAILIAILVPVLRQSRIAVRNTECMNNLRQIGVSCDSYVGDWQTYPPAQGYIYSRELDDTSLTYFLDWMPDVAPQHQGMWFCKNVKVRLAGSGSDYDYIPGMLNGPGGTDRSWTNTARAARPFEQWIVAHLGQGGVNTDPIHYGYDSVGNTAPLR
jgi:prepilin-type N-terminal cleavage/methylation domain-containing protein